MQFYNKKCILIFLIFILLTNVKLVIINIVISSIIVQLRNIYILDKYEASYYQYYHPIYDITNQVYIY